MPRSSKTMVFIATALVVGGLALCFAAFAAAGFDPDRLSTEPRAWVSNTRSFPLDAQTPPTSFAVRDEGQGVRVEAGEGDAIEVQYWTNERRRFNVSESDGSISFKTASEFFVSLRLEYPTQDHATVVKVPSGFTGSIKVESGNGDLEASGVESSSSIELKASNGTITAQKIKAAQLDMETSLGGIDASGLQAERLSARASSGSISLGQSTAAGSIYTSTSLGNQQLAELSAPRIDSHSSSGNVQARGLDGQTIAIESSLGNIDASVVGRASDYHIEAGASLGDVRAPEGSPTASRLVKLHASAGNIDLGFSG